jgi:predicted TIM-barrel fold metal-dependent hydrolase
MGTKGAYDPGPYLKACAQAEVRLFPAAFMDVPAFSGSVEAQDWLAARRTEGFLGVKLHPRQGRFDFAHSLLPDIISTANRLGLTPLLCTYFYSRDPSCRSLSVQTLRDLLHTVPEEKLILLHSGAACLLEVAEMTRHFKQVLLDLSFTLCEYAGSSLDMDLRYVLDRCRGRVCIGSDSPEYSQTQMRARFEELTQGFEQTHLEQIAYGNMFNFTGLAPR